MAGMDRLRIATRESPLALWQARHVQALVRAARPDLAVTLVPMTTQADQRPDRPLLELGGKGLFLKELEAAMARGDADLAVHSLKDVPAELPDGFVLAAVCAPADPRDALVGPWPGLAALPAGARVGTGSLRRHCQVRALRPDLAVLALRGNVGTRLRRLDEGAFDALILAAAGLDRLALGARIGARLAVSEMLPAPGQGVLALECRADAPAVRALLATLQDPATAARVAAERALTAALGADCHAPLAAHGVVEGARLRLDALVGSLDGTRLLRASDQAPLTDAPALGRRVAAQLRAAGADALLGP